MKSLFGGKSRDFITAVDEKSIIIVKELEDGEYRIRVPEFNHFCSTKGVSARYARKHLYESGMLRSSTDNGKINYTCPVQATDTKKTERCVCIIPKN